MCDFRFDETNMKSNACTAKDQCIAGIARVYQKIQDLLKEYKSKNAIYLNAGDNFQGTLWYNLLRWQVTADFITKLKPTAMVSTFLFYSFIKVTSITTDSR